MIAFFVVNSIYGKASGGLAFLLEIPSLFGKLHVLLKRQRKLMPSLFGAAAEVPEIVAVRVLLFELAVLALAAKLGAAARCDDVAAARRFAGVILFGDAVFFHKTNGFGGIIASGTGLKQDKNSPTEPIQEKPPNSWTNIGCPHVITSSLRIAKTV